VANREDTSPSMNRNIRHENPSAFSAEIHERTRCISQTGATPTRNAPPLVSLP
jgi:hypothetical protein